MGVVIIARQTATPTAAPIAASPVPGTLWASEYASGTAGRLAAGIDAGLGIVLVVFIVVVIYQWRSRSGGDIASLASASPSKAESTAPSIEESHERGDTKKDVEVVAGGG